MTTPIVTPVLVFGPDDLLVARSVEAALRHTEQHLKTADPKPEATPTPTPEATPTPTPERPLTLEDYEFFDFEGRPLAPVPGGLEAIEASEYLQHRVRHLLRRAWSESEAEADQRARHRELVEGFLEGVIDFRTVSEKLVVAGESALAAKHSRGGLHTLCHRVHLC